MDNRDEVRAFLLSRREKITPEQAGVPVHGIRRVAGLRRGEVATLAGVSIEYYTRLERGNLAGASEGVLDAIAQALQLNDTERAHLHDLARAASSSSSRTRRPAARAMAVRPIVVRMLEEMQSMPAFVFNARLDFLAANPLCRAVYSPMYADPGCGGNVARFVFLNPEARRFHVDWDRIAKDMVGVLRVEAGRNPHDRELSNLIGELSTRSEAFRVLWAAQDVHVFRQERKRLNHPVVGLLELDHETMELPGDSGQIVAVYSAPPGSPTADALAMLASWSATQEDSAQQAPAEADVQD
jgi:transcriptional regulator with XRE-family HTH domain